MSAASFVHLHVHTHYSLLDGACKIPELVKRTKALGMDAIGADECVGAVHDHLRGVEPVIAQQSGVCLLTLCELWGAERVAPPEVIPVVNVEGEGEDSRAVLVWVGGEVVEEFVGWRTA